MNVDQIADAYVRDGVVRVRQLLSPQELEEVRQALDRYRREVLPELPAADYTLEPDGETVRNFWRMHEHAAFFRDFSRRPLFLEIARRLVNGEPEVTGVETFNKPARVGSAVPYHQDNAYFCQEPADVFTLWIAIDAATVENGAVEYLAGTHRELLPHVPSGVKGNSYGLAEEPPEGSCPVFIGTLEPGDALIHHCQTVHRSHPNRSDRSRLGLVIVYRGKHTRTNPDLQEAYRRALALTPQNA